jgi:hypothetical protein
MWRRLALVGLVAVGCGPAIVIPADETSGSSEGPNGTGSTTGPVGSSGSIPPSTTVPFTTTTTDASTSGDTDSTGEDVSGGCQDFICETLSGSPIDECDPWQQDCPEGEKCMPWANDGGNAWNALKCSPIADNPDAPGEPCTVEGSGVSGLDSCDGTSMCWNVDPGTLQGTCHAFCTGSENNPTCDDACSVCALSGEGVLTLCIPTCDPLAQDCGDGLGCYAAYGDEFLCVFDASVKGGAPGDPCEFVNVCDPGTTCLPSELLPACEAIGCCSPFCTVGDATPCAAIPGTECVPFFEDGFGPTCGPSNVGVCSIPE